MGFNLNDIFGLNQVPAPQPTPANPPAPDSATPAPNDGKPPFEKSTTPDPAPLDNFAELFKVTPVDPNAPVPVDPNAPYFTMPTDEQLLQQVSSMKFINAEAHGELLSKAAGGDQGALIQLLNTVGQQSYAQGARLSANVAENATRNGVERLNAVLPNQIRSNLARNQVTELNPAFNHPALQPFVQSARTVMEQKFPNATANEIANMTNQYMESVRDSLVKPNPTQTQTPGGNTQIQDFSTFFGNR